MRGAVFGEPLRAHPAKIGLINAPGNTCVVEQQRATGCDENCDHGEHGLDAAALGRDGPDHPRPDRHRLFGYAHLHPFRGTPRRRFACVERFIRRMIG